MNKYQIEQPVIRQVQFAYRRHNFMNCYFYEFYGNRDWVLVPDGDCHLLWDVTKGCRIPFENEGCSFNKIEFFPENGHRYFGIAIAYGYILEWDSDMETFLLNCLKEKKSFEELVALCKKKRLIGNHLKSNHPMIVYGVKRMLETQGRVSVESIAMEKDYTTRQLERVFKKYYACSPKSMCRFIRLEKALDVIEENKACVFSEVSEQLGFADPSHFQREFKHFTGMTPKQFAIHYFNRTYE